MNPNKTKDFDLRQAISVVYRLRERASTCATHYGIKLRSLLLFLLIAPNLLAQDRKVDATWLHRYVPGLREHAGSLAFWTCHYKPIFGEGDTDNRILRTVTDRKSTRLNSSHVSISYAVFCLKKITKYQTGTS